MLKARTGPEVIPFSKIFVAVLVNNTSRKAGGAGERGIMSKLRMLCCFVALAGLSPSAAAAQAGCWDGVTPSTVGQCNTCCYNYNQNRLWWCYLDWLNIGCADSVLSLYNSCLRNCQSQSILHTTPSASPP